MQANISLIFNLLLLAGVIFAIYRIVRRQPNTHASVPSDNHTPDVVRDDIIAVRKVQPKDSVVTMPQEKQTSRSDEAQSGHELYFLVPKQRKSFYGYDLLQSLLAAKLRFGDNNFFHYYQQQNGKTEAIFSVTATTESGQFDLNQMHSFSTRGLCLYIPQKDNASVSDEARTILLETAQRLCHALDAVLLDSKQKPMTLPSHTISKEPEEI